MSVQIYTYEAHFKWKWHRDLAVWEIPGEQTVKDGITNDMKTAFLAEFAEKLAAAGHWYKMDDVATNFTKYTSGYTLGFPLPGYGIDVEGETTIIFETDVKDALAHASPQLWGIVQEAIYNVIAWLGAHPAIVVGIILFGIIVILTVWLINTATGAIDKVGEDLGSMILVMGLLAFGAFAIYTLFYTPSGRKAGTKGYQLARRGYRKVRGR